VAEPVRQLVTGVAVLKLVCFGVSVFVSKTAGLALGGFLASKCNKNRFRLGLHLGPRWGVRMGDTRPYTLPSTPSAPRSWRIAFKLLPPALKSTRQNTHNWWLGRKEMTLKHVYVC